MIVDVNAFPGFRGVPGAAEALAAFTSSGSRWRRVTPHDRTAVAAPHLATASHRSPAPSPEPPAPIAGTLRLEQAPQARRGCRRPPARQTAAVRPGGRGPGRDGLARRGEARLDRLAARTADVRVQASGPTPGSRRSPRRSPRHPAARLWNALERGRGALLARWRRRASRRVGRDRRCATSPGRGACSATPDRHLGRAPPVVGVFGKLFADPAARSPPTRCSARSTTSSRPAAGRGAACRWARSGSGARPHRRGGGGRRRTAAPAPRCCAARAAPSPRGTRRRRRGAQALHRSAVPPPGDAAPVRPRAAAVAGGPSCSRPTLRRSRLACVAAGAELLRLLADTGRRRRRPPTAASSRASSSSPAPGAWRSPTSTASASPTPPSTSATSSPTSGPAPPVARRRRRPRLVLPRRPGVHHRVRAAMAERAPPGAGRGHRCARRRSTRRRRC